MTQTNLYLVAIGTLFFLFGSLLERMNREANRITFNNRRYIPYEITGPEFLGRILEIAGIVLVSRANF